jgi:hypothetical protein
MRSDPGPQLILVFCGMGAAALIVFPQIAPCPFGLAALVFVGYLLSKLTHGKTTTGAVLEVIQVYWDWIRDRF